MYGLRTRALWVVATGLALRTDDMTGGAKASTFLMHGDHESCFELGCVGVRTDPDAANGANGVGRSSDGRGESHGSRGVRHRRSRRRKLRNLYARHGEHGGQIAFDALLGGPSTSGVFIGDGRKTSFSTRSVGGWSVPKRVPRANRSRRERTVIRRCRPL